MPIFISGISTKWCSPIWSKLKISLISSSTPSWMICRCWSAPVNAICAVNWTRCVTPLTFTGILITFQKKELMTSLILDLFFIAMVFQLPVMKSMTLTELCERYSELEDVEKLLEQDEYKWANDANGHPSIREIMFWIIPGIWISGFDNSVAIGICMILWTSANASENNAYGCNALILARWSKRKARKWKHCRRIRSSLTKTYHMKIK